MYFGEIGEIGVPTGSWEKNCYKASANPEFGSTLARTVNQSCFPAVLQSNQITIKFGTAEARPKSSCSKKSTTWLKYLIPLATVLDQISHHEIARPIALSALNCHMRVIFYHPSPIIFSFALSVRDCAVHFFSERDWTLNARSHNGVCLSFDC